LPREEFSAVVVERHRPQIFRFLLASTRDVDLAETLTQECFLKAHRNWGSFRGESSAMTWLMRIAINLQKDHWRNRRMQFWRQTRTNAVDLDEASEWLPSGERSAEQQLLAQGAGEAGVGGGEGFERAAADGFSAALCGRAGVERDCAGHGVERGHGEGAPFAGTGEECARNWGETMSLNFGWTEIGEGEAG
jgi:RNA polymerase sigma factor (sigma-70 family)